MKYLYLLLTSLFLGVASADIGMPDESVLASRDWNITYIIDGPENEHRKALSPLRGIQRLAANSSRVWLMLSQDGSMYFLEPGMDDGDNPLKLSSSETKGILTAACRLLRASPRSVRETGEKDVFTISVELRVGDSFFEYSDRVFQIKSKLPSEVFHLIQTMRPYSPEWTKALKI